MNNAKQLGFCSAMVCRAQLCYSKLSVCLSVCDVDVLWPYTVVLNFLKTITPKMRLGSSLPSCKETSIWSKGKSSRHSAKNRARVYNTRHRVVTYLQFHIHICFYAVNVNNNGRVVGCRQKTLHRAVSLRQHGFLVSSRLKTLDEGELLTESDRLFHAHWPAAAKTRSPVNLIGIDRSSWLLWWSTTK